MIKLYLIANNVTYDISDFLQKMTTSGRKGAAGRSLTATLLNASDFKKLPIDVISGNQIVAFEDGVELFQGLVVSLEEGKDRSCKIKAMDNLIYLANNEDTFSYTSKTASDIFRDLCARFQIAVGTVANTGYTIPKISMENSTLWDCLLEALQATYKATGARYYIASKRGKASLLRRVDEVQKWVIETGTNLVDYTLAKSIDEIVTRVKMVSSKGGTLAFVSNAALEKRLGIFQSVIKKSDDLNVGQLTSEAKSILKLEGIGKEQLSITGLGISSVEAGCVVYVIISELGIKQGYYVDEDSHTYTGAHHEMQLTLNKTNEI